MSRIAELRNKEVINISDGRRLGCVYDVEIDVCDGRVISIVVIGNSGFFGRDDEYIIPWCDIDKIGDDIILVNYKLEYLPRRKTKGLFW